MRIIRIYTTEDLYEDLTLYLNTEQSHYCSKVMRMRINDVITLFNGCNGEWQGVITERRNKKGIAVKVQKKTQEQINEDPLILYIALIKNTPLDNVVRQATESSVTTVKIVTTDYTSNNRCNIGRLRQIANEAAEQCGRMTVTAIHEPISLNDAMANLPDNVHLIYCNEREKNNTTNLTIKSNLIYAALIGPEGGFSARENQMLNTITGSQSVGLGRLILKADTAAINIISCINYLRQKSKVI